MAISQIKNNSLLPSDWAGSLGTNGYQRLPSGLILQWGRNTAQVGSSGTSTVTFPVAFPTACQVVTTTFQQAGGTVSGTSDLLVSAFSATGFTVTRANSGNLDSFTGFSWFAIGY
jgi:hypothetical protein